MNLRRTFPSPDVPIPERCKVIEDSYFFKVSTFSVPDVIPGNFDFFHDVPPLQFYFLWFHYSFPRADPGRSIGDKKRCLTGGGTAFCYFVFMSLIRA